MLGKWWRKPAPVEWLVVGLGNPEPAYAGTRHNVGFAVIDLLAVRWRIKVKKLAYLSLYGAGKAHNVSVGLLKPLTYMNASGDAAKGAAVKLQVPPERVLVILDDIALPLGALRVRQQGSDGGHKGLASILQKLGTRQVPRIRIGIGTPAAGQDATKWVLGRFAKEEVEQLQPSLELAADAAESILTRGLESTMNKYNARIENSS